MIDQTVSPAGISYKLATEVSQRTKLVITDVDGTLASFWDYFVPAVREFLRDVSDRLSIPANELAEDIGRIIDRRGTHEYPWLLEETAFAWRNFSDRPDVFLEHFVKPFWQSMDANRARYLRPYPHVIETLKELKRRGVKIVALSDAPDYMARIRNKQVFDGLLDAIYALETLEPDEKDIWQPISKEYGRQRLQLLQEATDGLKTSLHVLPKSFEKPCPNGLDRVLHDFDVFPCEALFIGDSLKKDGLVAAARGIKFIWAHYGYQLPAEYEEMVYDQLKPAGPCLSETIHRRVPYVEAIAARYDELLKHV